MQPFNLQPDLENELCKLIPLGEEDFESLYSVASDPRIWEQHPNRDRWKREAFMNFFRGAIESRGAYKIVEKATGKVIGSTRFYFSENDRKSNDTLLIGYTFYGTGYWGKGINRSVKRLMLDYAFMHVPKVSFHIGAENVRSQIAITRLGAKKTGEMSVAYYGEPVKLNYEYTITRDEWKAVRHQNDFLI